jgi:hypothetical protein
MSEMQAAGGWGRRLACPLCDYPRCARAGVARGRISNRHFRRLEFHLSPLPSMQIEILIGLK